MNLTSCRDYEALSRTASRWLHREIRRQPSALLCLATGGSPARAYDLFAEYGAVHPSTVRRLRVLKLDEWGGLDPKDPGTCESQLQRSVVRPLRLRSRYVGFRSNPAQPAAEAERLRRWLAANGPIDLCVLGLGLNGHLAFNEPAPFLQPHAHVATLSPTSLTHAMVQESRRRPKYGLTLGMTDLLQARRILLLVSGEAKRQPLARLLSGRISTDFPASFLWLHPAVTLLCDQACLTPARARGQS